MTSLSSQPYKGTRDYYPSDKRVQNYIFSVWKTVAERHGYEEYGAPLLEPLEVYTAKSGQELAGEQTYAFTDRGERTVAIRPEMTPSVSRMVAARRQELGYPARLYSIANFMRYERPQRGREREFWQCNVDVFGADGVYADAEIISLAYEMVKAFGAKDDMFAIKVNDRRVIDAMMREYLELDAVQSHMMIKLFDRKAKIPAEAFRDQAAEIAGEKAHEVLPKIATIITAQSIEELPQELHEVEAVAELRQLFELLRSAGVKNAMFDSTLMRGFDYYTGMVFEAFDAHPDNNRSMFGGGRYDGLVGLFGVESVPTVGMAPGLTTTQLFLEAHGLLPKLSSTTDVGIVVLGEESLPGALQLARTLRDEGVNAEVDITARKLDKQIKAVVKKQVPFMIFVGEDEVKHELYILKDVALQTEEKLGAERIISRVKDYRRASDDELAELFE
jgi:histidyl-tRNA synthetase